jgi:hypothetical protein
MATRSATSARSDFRLAWSVDLEENAGTTIHGSTSEAHMIRMSPAAWDAEPQADNVSDIVAQSQALAEQVEAMPDCVR